MPIQIREAIFIIDYILKPKTLETGDKIELFGGYDFNLYFLKIFPSDKRTGMVINL